MRQRRRYLAILAATSCAVFSVSGCAQQSDELSPIVRTPDPVNTIIYSHEHGDLKLDIIKPESKANLHLAIILIHGGGWVSENRKSMNEIGTFLAAKGFLSVSIDYRLAPKERWPAQLDDVQTAVRYVRSNAKSLDINPEKIGAAGISAGGHLSSLLGSNDTRLDREFKGFSSRVQAVCSISGIHDLNLALTASGERYRIVQQLLGEADKPNPSARAKASPIIYYDAKTAPTLFIQGKEDQLVPPNQTQVAEKKLRDLGIPTEAIYVDGMGHGLSTGPQPEVAALDQMVAWMKKYLAK